MLSNEAPPSASWAVGQEHAVLQCPRSALRRTVRLPMSPCTQRPWDGMVRYTRTLMRSQKWAAALGRETQYYWPNGDPPPPTPSAAGAWTSIPFDWGTTLSVFSTRWVQGHNLNRGAHPFGGCCFRDEARQRAEIEGEIVGCRAWFPVQATKGCWCGLQPAGKLGCKGMLLFLG